MNFERELLKQKFENYFHESPTDYIASPGRLEIIGNHTDHNNGFAIVAGASLYIKSAVKKDDNLITFYSEGRSIFKIPVVKSDPNPKEFSTTDAIIKGIIAGFLENGYKVGGFKSYSTSEVLAGSGISSSAAFEMLICETLNYLYNDNKIEKIELVKIAQKTECNYFGKPCGLLDQIGAAFGGISFVDFKDPKNPQVKNVQFPFDLKIVLTNPGGSHSGLDSYYASIPQNMKHVANVLGKKFLRETSLKEFDNFVKNNPNTLDSLEINRTVHYFNECERVKNAMKAIESNDVNSFIKNINESGYSSSNLLKNTLVAGRFDNSPERALEIARKVAPKSGHRVHGGGFMGTIISFCYEDEYPLLVKAMKETFGPKAVIDVNISNFGSSALR